MNRPPPPEGMGTFVEGIMTASFVPATDMVTWAKETFLDEGSPLFNEDHAHLQMVDFDFMWAAGGFEKQFRRVIGQTEELTFRAGPWQKGRQEQQMHEWYGRTPDYLITLDAQYCSTCSDMEFCALVDHELYHIGHKTDDFGAPAFTKDGMPKVGMRGHDVEEFIGVVARYGIGNPEGTIARLVAAANTEPLIANIDISKVCGTCLLKAS